MPLYQPSNKCHRSFKQWFDLLLHFHTEHGHCNVQRHQPGYRQLAGWVHRMRKKNKLGTLHSSEVESLDSIGFQWSHISSPLPLEDGIAFLEEFKRKHGNCNVPYTYRHNQRLATWAHNQRSQLARKLRHQSSTMTKERLERLTAVGLFDFRSRDTLISLLNIPDNDPYKPPPVLHPSNFGTYQCNLNTFACRVNFNIHSTMSSFSLVLPNNRQQLLRIQTPHVLLPANISHQPQISKTTMLNAKLLHIWPKKKVLP